VSVRKPGEDGFRTKTELKNMNSFRFLERGIEAEIERQISTWESGGTVVQETIHFDPVTGSLTPLRSKEEVHDYRYFPEPDLMPMVISDEWREQVRATLPELPEARRRRFIADYGLREYDAGVLTGSRALADYYEQAARAAGPPQAGAAAHWVQGELLGALNAAGKDIGETPVSAEHLGELVRLISDGAISGKIAKSVFEKMFQSGKPPREVIAQESLAQISDAGQLEAVIREVLAANPKQLAQYRGGKSGVFGYFVGQVMKATRGQANPALVNDLLKKHLDAPEAG
jgi:aspartyl-tRNA(Asn)/glutamyl-tRNA(Gln) amidotransferase subunit B